MASPHPIRIVPSGRLGRADIETTAGRITVVTASPGSIAAAALAARRAIRLAGDEVAGTVSLRSATDLDLAAQQAAAAARCGVTVGLGGDVAIAGPPPESGWRIGLAGWSVSMSAGGVATARTRGNESLWRSITVAADTWRAARSAAGRAIDRGQEAVLWLCANDLRGRLVRGDGSVTFAGVWPLERPAA